MIDESGTPMTGLQQMLLTISYLNPVIPAPANINNMEDSISAFQQYYGLPVTGVVDQATFERIVLACDLCTELLSDAAAPILHFPANQALRPGQSHPFLFLAQGIFSALAQDYSEFMPLRVSGMLDAPTEHNLRIIQNRSALPETGHLDKRTYNRLSQLYRASYDRKCCPSQG